MTQEAMNSSVAIDSSAVDMLRHQRETVDRKIINLQEYRNRLVQAENLLAPPTPHVRNIMESAMNLLRGRGSVRITWVVDKLAPVLQREDESRKAFYKVIHASLTGNARRENPRVRIPKRGMVIALAA
jgi:hypothetical protein